MPVVVHAGKRIEVSEAGFLLDGDCWTPSIAEGLARLHGVECLRGSHWRLVTLCREEAARSGACPTVDHMRKLSGMSLEALDELFAGDVRRVLAALAGLAGPLCEKRR